METFRRREDFEKPVVRARVTPAGFTVAPAPEPIARAAEPLQPPLPEKDQKNLDRCKAVAALKAAWQAKEDEIARDREEADARKKRYEEARSGLGQEEVDWARSKGWIGAI